MTNYLILTINILVNAIGILLLLYIVLSYFMSPFHPIRESLSRVMDPMLNPIRRVMPPIAGLDFSPLILWLIIRLLDQFLVRLIASL